MRSRELEESLRETLVEDGKRSTPDHHFHPSQITGCPLKVMLNEKTDHETTLNSWLFQGSAVHYYLQETGLLDAALQNAGFHPAFIEYEENIKYPIAPNVWINGTCDIKVKDKDTGELTIYDIKYSSIPVESNHPRIYKYFSQANTYAKMFGAENYGLIMINSRSQKLGEDIHVLSGELSDENWDIVKSKAINISESLSEYDDEKWEPDWLREKRPEFWKQVTRFFDRAQIPAYDGECKYCSHSDYCPEKNGVLGGVNELIEGSK